MAASASDTQEFIRLLTDHQEILRSYIYSQMPSCPDVRDILQEVNVVLWEKMSDFELGTNFGAWSCTVAYYVILNHRKKMRRDGFLIFNEELCQSLATESAKREPAILESKRLALQTCLGKLTPENRELLEIRYENQRGGMSRLAEETGRSRASLRVTLSRLRASLRQCIRSTMMVERGAR
ncbi:sigma-70 family RNA polymerase sigma factor [Haloferula chungangensis]|uniref:Sigma-70 family RNA polymerase sigma factor n=1 Tax=Haloferula chungangensis TaxID=1048331 RepID=A0ABW2LBP1_9BACT